MRRRRYSILQVVVVLTCLWFAVAAPDASATTHVYNIVSVPYEDPVPSIEQTSAFQSVSCYGVGECVAVGSLTTSGGQTPLIERSSADGTWTVESAPKIAPVMYLDSVSCTEADFCIAVGYKSSGTTSPTLNLALQWNGSSWSEVQSGDLTSDGSNAFRSVACLATSFCMAVGTSDESNVLHGFYGLYVGARFQVGHDHAYLGYASAPLSSVSCSSTVQCVAVDGTFAETWDGRSWQPSYPHRTNGWTLDAISCPAINTCYAAGTYDPAVHRAQKPLLEQWSGSTWAVVPTAYGAYGNMSNGISCETASICDTAGASDYFEMHGTHWWTPTVTQGDPGSTGRLWWGEVEWPPRSAMEQSPVTPYAILQAVSCFSGLCVAVGSYTSPIGPEVLVESGPSSA